MIYSLLYTVANHGGIFTFAMCYRDSFNIKETEECFVPLKLSNGDSEYELKSRENTLFPITVTIPPKTCKACVFRWNWRAGKFYLIII